MEWMGPELLPEDEAGVVAAQDAARTGGRYVGAVQGFTAILARRGDLLLACALTLAGLVEVLLGPADGRLLRALAVPVATLPLARRRDLPLLALVAVASTLLVQAAAADFFDASQATPLVVMVIALYSAGRHARGLPALAAAAVAAAALAATRIVFDPEVDDAGAAALTVIAVALPLLIGAWVRGQSALHREFAANAARRERERERDAQDAAEEERMRIAADLQAAVADRLEETVGRSAELRRRLEAGEIARAHELLTTIAGAAREALADVRRVLGILRRDETAPLAPPSPPADAEPTPTTDAAPARAAATPTPGADSARPAATPTPHAASASAATTPMTHPASEPAAAPASHAASAPPVDSTAPVAAAPTVAAERARARRLRLLDRLLVAALLAGAELELLIAASEDRVFAALSAVAIVIPLLWRRRHPIPVALAALAAVAVQSTVVRPDSFPAADAIVLMCATYAVGAYQTRRPALIGLGLFAVGNASHAAVFFPDAVPIALFASAIVPWTVGRIVRAQRQLMSEAREHATQVERARARDARAAVTAERMRVARELHDAVAHNISVIAIQAAGAQGVLERDRARAAECAALIEQVGRDAIVELRRLTGGAGGADGPQPTLARVDALAQRAREGGLPVDLRVEGDPARIAAGVDLAAFRIVQEALANTSKHAGAAHAWVVVRYEQRAVEVEIGDDGRKGSASQPSGRGGGHGLIGMRERVALYGGTLDAGRRPGGGFAVRARLPLGGA
jgi:signal transduction histidine kinase